MKYNPPSGGGPTDPYIDANPGAGIEGSPVPAAFPNSVQNEIVNVIVAAGLTPDGTNNAQLLAAIKEMIEVFTGAYALDTGAANAYVIALNPVITAYTAGLQVRFRAVHANTGACTLDAGGGPIALKDVDGNALLGGDVPANYLVTANYDAVANAFLATNIQSTQRIRLSANTTFFVSAAGGNDANSGLSSGAAWQTVQHAWNVLQSTYDLNGFTATVSVANGTYTSGLQASGSVVGQISAANIVFQGNTGAPASVLFSTTTTIIAASQGALLTVTGFDFTCTGGNSWAITADGDARVVQSLNIFGACGAGHMESAHGAAITCSGNYTINGAAPTHWLAEQVALLTCDSVTVTITGTPAITSFAQASQGGVLEVIGVTFTGSTTGQRYNASSGGTINTNGAGSSYIPGSTAGSSTTGYYT